MTRGGEGMNHSFDVDVAVKYGVNAAVLLNNIYFWVQKNEANRHNFHDGYYWTYNSRNAFTEIFPYLSERQIKTALDKLIEDGVIKTGCYNKESWDRTLWYAITEKGLCIMRKCQMQDAEMSNAHSDYVRPIPDSKTTDINADIKPDISISSIDDDFSKFWAAYPRKDGKADALKAWKSLKPNADLQRVILEDLRRRMESGGAWYKTEKRFIKLPASYLRGRRWEDEGGVTEVAEHREPDPIVLTDEERAEIDRIYAQNGRDAFM